VKVALLDQQAVAGIGNIYAAEILFAAGIDPRVPCARLSVARWEQIATAARSILAEAVRLEGSTITDETYKTADNRSGQFQLQHRVYGLDGKPCRQCGTAIQRIVQAQRSTFFCPQCQWHHRRRCRRLS
jgi:formamidopyrimidine-DNA glycosylase